MITADQIVCHLVGDYIIQSDWMANEKRKRSLAAGLHAVTYAIPFLFLTFDPLALGIIAGTHYQANDVLFDFVDTLKQEERVEQEG